MAKSDDRKPRPTPKPAPPPSSPPPRPVPTPAAKAIAETFGIPEDQVAAYLADDVKRAAAFELWHAEKAAGEHTLDVLKRYTPRRGERFDQHEILAARAHVKVADADAALGLLRAVTGPAPRGTEPGGKAYGPGTGT